MAKTINSVEELLAEVRRRDKQRAKAAKAAEQGKPAPAAPATGGGGGGRQKWALTPLAQEVPKCGKRGQAPAEFIQWFDNLTLAQVQAYMNDRGDPEKKTKGARDRIKEEVRKGPEGQAGAHEWLKCSQMVKVKEWGISMRDVWATAQPTGEVEGFRFMHPTSGDRGSPGSKRMHDELDGLFERSNSRDEFLNNINNWADGTDRNPPSPRLFRGHHDLPEGLRLRR